MPVGKISFVGVKTEFEPVPAGSYEARFSDFNVGKVKGGKNQDADKIDLTFTITEDGDYHGRKLFRTCTLIPDALWAFKATMAALGVEADWDSEEGVDVEDVARAALDNRAIVNVSVSEYTPEGATEPKKQNRVDSVKPLSSTYEEDVPEVPEVVNELYPVAATSGRGRR